MTQQPQLPAAAIATQAAEEFLADSFPTMSQFLTVEACHKARRDKVAALILSAAAKIHEESRAENVQKIISIIEPIYDHDKLDALGGQLSYVAERILDRITPAGRGGKSAA